MKIGAYKFSNTLIAAPMAGVTDLPFRRLCLRLGADLAVSEMLSSQPDLVETRKSRLRRRHPQGRAPAWIQIAGSEPSLLADAARFNVDCGARIIDINMGCPAKKVCRRDAGSALLGDERRVANILTAVVAAVNVPVTLKIRTGISRQRRNAVNIAVIAEDCGIAALSIHGRTRECAFRGEAEYRTIAAAKRAVSIPVIANGDIDSPRKAARVLALTGADGLMIGRAAQGNPWIFRDIGEYLRSGRVPPAPSRDEVSRTLLGHLEDLYAFYGESQGVRIARKHLSWYCKPRPGGSAFWKRINRIESAASQWRMARDFFDRLPTPMDRAA